MTSEVRSTVDSSFWRHPKDLEKNAKTNARHYQRCIQKSPNAMKIVGGEESSERHLKIMLDSESRWKSRFQD